MFLLLLIIICIVSYEPLILLYELFPQLVLIYFLDYILLLTSIEYIEIDIKIHFIIYSDCIELTMIQIMTTLHYLYSYTNIYIYSDRSLYYSLLFSSSFTLLEYNYLSLNDGFTYLPNFLNKNYSFKLF